MPLAGEMQPGAFFFPFNLLLLLQKGVLCQRICMQIIAGTDRTDQRKIQ